MTPFQIIFTPTAAAELGTLPKELQLEILGDFRGLPNDVRSDEMDSFGRLNRDGRHLFRFRLGSYRVYFERHELGVLIHRILHAKKTSLGFSLSQQAAGRGRSRVRGDAGILEADRVGQVGRLLGYFISSPSSTFQ